MIPCPTCKQDPCECRWPAVPARPRCIRSPRARSAALAIYRPFGPKENTP